MTKPKTKVQKILDYCQRPRTSVQIRAKFGGSKSTLAALRRAGCITSERRRADKVSRAWFAVYCATGKAYAAVLGTPVRSDDPEKRAARLRWDKANEAKRLAYRKAYRALNRDRINALKRASSALLRSRAASAREATRSG